MVLWNQFYIARCVFDFGLQLDKEFALLVFVVYLVSDVYEPVKIIQERGGICLSPLTDLLGFTLAIALYRKRKGTLNRVVGIVDISATSELCAKVGDGLTG